MQVALIIGAIIVSIAAFLLACVRVEKIEETANKIYDPKLRVTAGKRISEWILMLICAASLISLIWLFGIFGRLYNYEGGFSLRPSESWRLVESEAENSGQYNYVHSNNDYIRINVASLNSEEAKAKRAEIKQTRKDLVSSFEEKEKQLIAEAKNTKKELRAKARANEKEIKSAYKLFFFLHSEDRQQRNAAIKENKKQLKTDIENTKIELEKNLANNKENMKNIWRNGWLRRETGINNFIAMRNVRLYTVDTASRANLSNLNIGPSGFFIGVFDGSTFPVMFFLARNDNSLHPYKEINNGASYLSGFILGSIFLLTFVIWLTYIIATKISREHWKKKWPAMSIDDKVTYLTMLYENEQVIKELRLEEVKQESKSQKALVKSELDMSPSKALEALDAPEPEKGKLEKFGKGFLNIVTAEGYSKGVAEDEYNDMKMVFDYFDSEYQIASARVDIASTRYTHICRIAGFYILQMQELIASFTYEQKDRFIQTGEMELNTVEFNEIKAQKFLEEIEKFNKEFEIRTEALWKETLNFANSISNVASLGKLGPALGIGVIVLAGAINYVDIRNKNIEIKARLLEARAEIRNAITETKKNKSKAENFVKRADELCDYLDESIKRYKIMFTEIYGQLFPEGDKTKSEREKREKEGGEYYTDEEFMIIRPLGKYAKIMSQVIEADL